MSVYDKVNLVLVLLVIGYLLWCRYKWRVELDWETDYIGDGKFIKTGINLWWWDKYHSQGNLVLRVPFRRTGQ
jgi:hypothetical protein